MKVYIDASSDVDYSAFYILGLYNLFGKERVFFSSKYFENITSTVTFNFIIQQNKGIIKYAVDYGDMQDININVYNWCDYYGKINYNKNFIIDTNNSKIIKLAPGFGIKVWNDTECIFLALMNFVKLSNKYTIFRKFLGKYYKQHRHVSLESYTMTPVDRNYIYTLNTLWQSDEWVRNDEAVNKYRTNFIKACKSIKNLNFEGGFIQSQIKNIDPRFQSLILDKSFVSKNEYISKIKRSVLVFNTPAWGLCHGWKLGEYLALGKAIISTPLVNELPSQLEHGIHIHFVSGEIEEMIDAIQLIIEDDKYRNHLEQGAYNY